MSRLKVPVFPKEPSETLAYQYTPADDMQAGDSLVALGTVITITPTGGLTNVFTQTTATVVPSVIEEDTVVPLVNMYLGGGISGVTYKVTIQTATAYGQGFEDEFYVRVSDQ